MWGKFVKVTLPKKYLCGAKNTNFLSLYQCIDNLGPVYLVEKRFLIGQLPWWSPLIGYCLQIMGPILQYYCLYQLGSVATSLSNSNIWQKIEIKQIIAGFVEPESFPTMITWYNKKTIYPMCMMRRGPICLNFYSSDMILRLSVSWCHMRMSEPLSIIITLRQCVFSQWSASSNVILLYVLFNFYRGNFGFCDVRLSIDLNYLSSSHR